MPQTTPAIPRPGSSPSTGNALLGPLWMRAALLGVTLLVALSWLGGGCASQRARQISALHHFKQGNQSYRIGNLPKAVFYYQQALALDPRSAETHYNLGLTYYQSGNFREAIGAFQSALALRPNMAVGHYNLALAHDRLYNPDAAHSHYNRYRELVSAATPIQQAGNRSPRVKRATGRSGLPTYGVPSQRRGTKVQAGQTPTRRQARKANGFPRPTRGKTAGAQRTQRTIKPSIGPSIGPPTHPPRTRQAQQTQRRPGARSRLSPNRRGDAGQGGRKHQQPSSGESKKWWIHDR